LANNWFQFKQFIVHQGDCAMKVTTDACLFGAWIPLETDKPCTILDIGAGTGVLAVMLAQRSSKAEITAVEIDEAAAKQARENAAASPFSDRIHIVHQPIQAFAAASTKKYDLIVSNPPFFKNHLLSPQSKVNAARHQESLGLEDLSQAIASTLSPNGIAAVLLPENESNLFSTYMAKVALFPLLDMEVRNKPGEAVFRKMILYQFNYQGDIQIDQFEIRDANGQYAKDFVQLLQPYYLHL